MVKGGQRWSKEKIMVTGVWRRMAINHNGGNEKAMVHRYQKVGVTSKVHRSEVGPWDGRGHRIGSHRIGMVTGSEGRRLGMVT